MKIQCRFFASVREQLGVAEEVIIVPEQVTTVGELRQFLVLRGGVWAQVLGNERNLRMAYDHNMTEADTLLTEACEVAFFPLVTGG